MVFLVPISASTLTILAVWFFVLPWLGSGNKLLGFVVAAVALSACFFCLGSCAKFSTVAKAKLEHAEERRAWIAAEENKALKANSELSNEEPPPKFFDARD